MRSAQLIRFESIKKAADTLEWPSSSAMFQQRTSCHGHSRKGGELLEWDLGFPCKVLIGN